MRMLACWQCGQQTLELQYCSACGLFNGLGQPPNPILVLDSPPQSPSPKTQSPSPSPKKPPPVQKKLELTESSKSSFINSVDPPVEDEQTVEPDHVLLKPELTAAEILDGAAKVLQYVCGSVALKKVKQWLKAKMMVHIQTARCIAPTHLQITAAVLFSLCNALTAEALPTWLCVDTLLVLGTGLTSDGLAAVHALVAYSRPHSLAYFIIHALQVVAICRKIDTAIAQSMEARMLAAVHANDTTNTILTVCSDAVGLKWLRAYASHHTKWHDIIAHTERQYAVALATVQSIIPIQLLDLIHPDKHDEEHGRMIAILSIRQKYLRYARHCKALDMYVIKSVISVPVEKLEAVDKLSFFS